MKLKLDFKNRVIQKCNKKVIILSKYLFLLVDRYKSRTCFVRAINLAKIEQELMSNDDAK